MKNRSTLFLLLITATLLCLNSCKKNKSGNYQLQNVIGYVQKGPFINGTSITIFDLQQDLLATGKSFNTQIVDNKGTFELNNMTLSSKYTSLRADGFYFNEVTGQQSASQITLYALSDITGKSNININILTTLEKPRVEFLVKNGKSFEEAKIQAQKEILAIFNITKSNTKSSESLDISGDGEDNAILLAISSIIQGYRSESEMSELISNIGTDIREDGILNSQSIGSSLLTHAKSLNVNSIKNILSKRYSDMGSNSNIPDFEKYVSEFISKTTFLSTQSVIYYPEKGLTGENILTLDKTNYSLVNGGDYMPGYQQFSFAATVPKGGKLVIVLTSTMPTFYVTPLWSFGVSSVNNWSITTYSSAQKSQSFTVVDSGKSSDVRFISRYGSFKIEYFEMNAVTATRTKTITIQ